MKKVIQILIIIILVLILSLIIIAVFNPFNLRTKMIASMINSYLSSTIEGYEPLDTSIDSSGIYKDNAGVTVDKNPMLNEEQEKVLESYGVDVSQLPSSVSSEMKDCLVEKVGTSRAQEIVNGATPSAMEIFKAKSCLN
ncbi:hypothetical protein C0583_00555 [Candidatus Parcubacteria bacterium]|nr:MAG: hypothetical protein C0583_00555 [Candidatus Parcubacteria bacterium]